MYSTQIIADRISEEVKRQNKNKTAMLKELKYGVNTISEMRKGKQMVDTDLVLWYNIFIQMFLSFH